MYDIIALLGEKKMELKDLKSKIKEVILKGYKLKTNFRSNEFFVEIGAFIIIAKPICSKTKVKYEFMLDIQFLSSDGINHAELIMLEQVINILEENRKLATSCLKKWTVNEFLKDQDFKKRRSEEFFEALKNVYQQRQ